ncbi:MAG: DUF5719 family protein [Candidatus Geothermincolia bacterium]
MSLSKTVRTVIACMAVFLMTALPLFGIAPAAAAGDFVFDGSGWGHGVGMCQYGALGMAEAGYSAEQIMGHYFPGTAVTAWPCPETLEIILMSGATEIQLRSDSGSFYFISGSAAIPNSTASPGQLWRVRPAGTGAAQVIAPDGSVLNGQAYASPIHVDFTAGGGVLRLPQNQNYGYGDISVARGTPLRLESQTSSMRAVLVSDFETYLKGIGEVPASWPAAAQQAQALAARSYAARKAGAGLALYDDTRDQYYIGYDKEQYAAWVAAVDATAGRVVTYEGAVSATYYSSSCGGHTEDAANVWGGASAPYLRGVPDPWCMDQARNPHAVWQVVMTPEQLAAKLAAAGRDIGTPVSMDLSDRAVSGRVRHAVFPGTAGSTTLTGEQLRGVLGLKSAMVNTVPDNFDTYVLLANPDAAASASATVTFYGRDGAATDVHKDIPPLSRVTVRADDYLYDQEVSALVSSDQPVVAERAMYFNYQGTMSGGSVAEGVPAPSDSWYFAEGYTAGGFDTWLLLFNPDGDPTNATLELLRDDGYAASFTRSVPGQSRISIPVDSLPGFENAAFSAHVMSEPGVVVAERAMYFDYGGRRGGHAAPGATATANTWYLPEGYTAGAFDTYVLIGNPFPEAARVDVTFMTPTGTQETTVDVPGRSRKTIIVDDYLASHEVSTMLSSDRPIVAEEAVYFSYSPDAGFPRDGGSCIPGVTAPRETWYFAEGYTGTGFDEYILVQNPGARPTTVTFKFLTAAGLARQESFEVPARSRFTLPVHRYVPGEEVSVAVSSSGAGVVAVRSMYFDYRGKRGGHAAAGCPVAGNSWYFAEGYTGD